MRPDAPTCSLRERIVALTYQCPKGAYVPRCPFATLKGLSDLSRRSILGNLNYTTLAGLFDLAPTCSCPADPGLREQGAPSIPSTPPLVDKVA